MSKVVLTPIEEEVRDVSLATVTLTPIEDEGRPSFLKDVVGQTAKDVGGVAAHAGAGLIKGVTLGGINPEEGTVGIPFTKQQWKVAPTLGEKLEAVGVSPDIARNQYIGLAPEMLGTAGPWSMTSKLIQSIGKMASGVKAGKALSATAQGIGDVAAAGEKGSVITRAGHQALAGAAIGAAEVLDKDDSRLDSILQTAAIGAGFSLLGDGIHAIATKTGMNKAGAYQKLKDELTDFIYNHNSRGFTASQAARAADIVIEKELAKAGIKNPSVWQLRKAKQNVSELKDVVEQAKQQRETAKAEQAKTEADVGTAQETAPESDIVTIEPETKALPEPKTEVRQPESIEPIKAEAKTVTLEPVIEPPKPIPQESDIVATKPETEIKAETELGVTQKPTPVSELIQEAEMPTKPQSLLTNPWQVRIDDIVNNDMLPIKTDKHLDKDGNPVYIYQATVNWDGKPRTFEVKMYQPQNPEKQTRILHRKMLEKAINESKPIPPEIADDYPEYREDIIPYHKTLEGELAFAHMREIIKSGSAGLNIDEDGVIHGRFSSHASWFRDISNKHKISAVEADRIIQKVINGKPLTARQGKAWTDIRRAAYDIGSSKHITRMADEIRRANEQVKTDLGQAGINPGEIGNYREDIETGFLDSLTAEEGITEEEFAAIKDELSKFLDDISQATAKSPQGQNRGKLWTGEAYRAETGYKHDAGTTAADVIRYEQDVLGNDYGITPEELKVLELYPADDVVWVTRTKEDAARYGDSIEDVVEHEIPEGSTIIAEDGEGGFLVLKNRPAEQAEVKTEDTRAGKQTIIEGTSKEENFTLENPETDWSKHRPVSEQPYSRSHSLFNKGQYAKSENKTAKEDAGNKSTEDTTTDQQQEDAVADERRKRDTYAARRRAIVEMPELVEIVKSLTRGQRIKLARKLAKDPAVTGLFIQRGTGSIKLKLSVFKDPEQAAKTLAHEIGHLWDYLPLRSMKQGNILGRIATIPDYLKSVLPEFKGAPGELTKEDRQRLWNEARKFKETPSTVVIEKIIEEIPIYEVKGIDPELILDLMRGRANPGIAPELWDYLQRAEARVKAEIVKKALKGIIDERVADFGEKKQVGVERVERTIERTIPGKTVKDRFRELLEEELKKRILFDKDTIMDELKGVSQIWKPFNEAKDPKYTKYRYSSAELYADAVSVLFNDPALLKQEAPTFWKAFFNWLDQKPEVKRIYDEIQDRIRNDADKILHRQKTIREGFREAEENIKQKWQEKEQIKASRLLRDLERGLFDQNEAVLRKIREAEKKGARYEDADNPKYWVQELPYISSECAELFLRINKRISKPMEADGLSVDDLGEYLEMRRIIAERSEIANPGGHTAETAAWQLENLHQQLGAEKYAKLEQYAEQFWKELQPTIKELKEARMYSEPLMAKIESNKYYATFQVIDQLEHEYGPSVTGHVYKQVGTLSNIRNPYIATIFKYMALTRAAEVTKAKQSIVKLFLEHFPAKIELAKTRRVGKYNEPVEPNDPDKGLVVFLYDGKPMGYYLPKDIADTFNRKPYEARTLMKAWQKVMIPVRAILVNRNPIWMVANIVRDFMGTLTNIEGITARKLAKLYIESFKDAYEDSFGEVTPDIVLEMMRKKMLVIDRQYTLADTDSDTELDLFLQSLGKTPARYRNKVVKPLAEAWDALGKTGKMSERIGKIAAYRALLEKGKPERETAMIVRTRAATPDVYRRGAWHIVTNNLWLFSNVGKEGFRSSWESFKDNPGSYAWKTFKYNIVPKLIYRAAKYGLLGAGIAAICAKVNKYDEDNYIVVPLYMTEEGHARYLTIPQSYTGQVIGGVFNKIMDGEITGKKGAISYTVSSSPYGSLTPYLSAGLDLALYYGLGVNPYDYYYGKTVLTDQEYNAGGWDAAQGLIRNTWKELGGQVIYKPTGDLVDKQTDTAFEKMLRVPPLNILGKFLKSSNKGELDDYGDIIADVKSDEAKRSLEVKRRIVKHINDTEGKAKAGEVHRLYMDLVRDGVIKQDRVRFGQFRTNYIKLQSKSKDVPMLDALGRATTIEQKVALLHEYKTRLSPVEFAKLLNDARQSKLITPTVLREFQRSAK